MTLDDLASYITQKTQLVEPDDLAAARLFLSKRYELIWNQFLWKDSLALISLTVDPTTNDDNADGIVLLPEIIDMVCGLRSDTNSIQIHALEEYFRIDYDAFQANQMPTSEFVILSPVWFVWRGGIGLKINNSDPQDNGKVIKIIWRDTAGVQYNQNITLNSINNPLLTDPSDFNTVIVTGAGLAAANGTYTQDGTQYVKGDYTIVFFTDSGTWNLMFGGQAQYISFGADIVGTWVVDQGPGPAPTVAYGVKSKLTIEAVFKPILAGTVSLNPQISGEQAGGTLPISTLAARSPSHQRVRLFSKPTQQFPLNVLGKRKIVPLNFGAQEPDLRNLDNCLISFASGDLLIRERHYAKAASEYQQGEALLKELASMQTIQQANHVQFQPEGGYGDLYFSPNSNWGYFFP